LWLRTPPSCAGLFATRPSPSALDAPEPRIVGVANNVEFLSCLVVSPAFAQADLDTGLIERERTFLFPEQGAKVPRDAYLVAALATVLREEDIARNAAVRHPDPYSPWHRLDGWRLNSGFERRLLFRHGESETAVVVGYSQGHYALSLDGATTLARGELGPNSTLRVELAGLRLDATVVVAGERRHVFLNGRSYQLARVDPLYHGGEGQGVDGRLVAPMPGRVVAWLAKPGSNVEKGAPLLILEAMKMEHTITAPSAGKLEGFRFAVGEQVTEGAELVDFVRSE
jgi:3-methylcrotonyl-CoA carboxylase alpha subunit